MKRVLFLMIAVLGLSIGVSQAQPYKHSVGVIAGYYDGFNYKGFLKNKLALDATVAYTVREGGLVINPALLYQDAIPGASGLNWFVGGGIFGGVASSHFGYLGFHAMAGLEYKFNIPLAISFDFRPGVGIGMNAHGGGYWYNDTYRSSSAWAYFSWPINLTARYAF